MLDSGKITESPALVLSEIESFDQRPSRGNFKFRAGEKSENIEFGTTQGLYATGLFIKDTLLPEPWAKRFKGSQVLQIAFMNSPPSSGSNLIPQFATLLVSFPKFPKQKQFFKIGLPTGKNSGIGVLLVSSPKTVKDLSQEERLKGTFFSESGGGDLLPLDKSEKLAVKSVSGKYLFRHQVMRINLSAKLVTPFNPASASLNGSVDIPCFWPADKDSELLVKKMASQAFEQWLSGPSNLPAPPPNRAREIAGSSPKSESKLGKDSPSLPSQSGAPETSLESEHDE